MSSAYQVPKLPTAFSMSPKGQRRPRLKVEAHLKFIRGLPCLCCGSRVNVEAAHVRYPDPRYGKRETGLSEKPDDRWTVPLAAKCHREQHAGNEKEWWAAKAIDPVQVAAALYGSSGDDEAAELILKQARR